MKKITLVKFGGAVITNKEIPNQLRKEVLTRLVKEIKQAQIETSVSILLGNGVGSFAHVPASHYKTMDGFINSESKMGMAITQDSAAQINRLVVQACLEQELPAVSLSPANTIVSKNRQADSYCTDILEEYLTAGLLPVTYGDVLVDRQQGCTIWSTDTVFSFLARQLSERGWQIDQIIHVTEAEGVWKMTDGKFETKNGDKVVYPLITPDMKEEVKTSMSDIRGFDVTGGMWHKIEESLSLADLGIKIRIISGLKPGSLYKTLVGQEAYGTTITH